MTVAVASSFFVLVGMALLLLAHVSTSFVHRQPLRRQPQHHNPTTTSPSARIPHRSSTHLLATHTSAAASSSTTATTATDAPADDTEELVPYLVARGDGSTGGGGRAMPHSSSQGLDDVNKDNVSDGGPALRRPQVGADMPRGRPSWFHVPAPSQGNANAKECNFIHPTDLECQATSSPSSHTLSPPSLRFQPKNHGIRKSKIRSVLWICTRSVRKHSVRTLVNVGTVGPVPSCCWGIPGTPKHAKIANATARALRTTHFC